MTITANLTADITLGRAPLVVTFTNTSVGAITSTVYDFGDGASTDYETTSAVHVYTEPGIYTVKLIVKNDIEEDVKILDSYIVVEEKVEEPDFVILLSENSDTNEYWKFYVDLDKHLIFETHEYVWRSVDPIIYIHRWTFVMFNKSEEKMYISSARSKLKIVPSTKSVNTTPIIPSSKKIYVVPNSTMKIDELQVWSKDVDFSNYTQSLRGIAGRLDDLDSIA